MIRNLEEMVFEKQVALWQQPNRIFQLARESDRKLARRVINGERFDPGGDCPPQVV